MITETGLYYFFSTLAQCAAGFAALVGVFAVFRLQANAFSIEESYAHARRWMLSDLSSTDINGKPRQQIKEALQRIQKRGGLART